MIALIQRVTEAAVKVDGTEVGRIGPGLLALIGVQKGDGEANAVRMAERIAGYRVFPDAEVRMNLSLLERGGELLLVPQFTLAADTQKGTRPSFSSAAPPETATRLFEVVVAESRRQGLPVATGCFGAEMHVSLINHGPVTFSLHA